MPAVPATITDPPAGLDLDVAWRLSPSVSLRPEPFGALVYDFSTRRLSFLKSLLLLAVVRGLEQADDVHQALTAALQEFSQTLYQSAQQSAAGDAEAAPDPAASDDEVADAEIVDEGEEQSA